MLYNECEKVKVKYKLVSPCMLNMPLVYAVAHAPRNVQGCGVSLKGYDIGVHHGIHRADFRYVYRVHMQKNLTECKSDVCNVTLPNGRAAQLDITRAQFEELCREDFQRVTLPLDRVRFYGRLTLTQKFAGAESNYATNGLWKDDVHVC